MAQIIKHRRGTAAQLKTTTLQKGELGVSTGSVSGLTTPILHVGDGANAAGFVVGRLHQGATVPTLNSGDIGASLNNILFHDSATYKLVRLHTDGNETLNLSANIVNVPITGSIHLSGNLSSSLAGTGSFGRVEATTVSATSIAGTLTTAAQTNITSVGTIGTGTWQGTAIASAYLDADTAHLTTDQTFSGKKTFSAPITASAGVSIAGDLTGSATTTASFGYVTVDGDISASGNIHAVGNITFEGGSSGTITMGSAADDNVVFAADVNSNIIPNTDNTYDLGSTSQQWRNIFTGDLHLSNMTKDVGNEVDGTKGDWTIQEGENDLYILNRLNGKKYKFKLEEIQ